MTIILPLNCTALIQTMDQIVILNISIEKLKYSIKILKKFIFHLVGQTEKTTTLKKLNVKNVTFSSSHACSGVTPRLDTKSS